MLVVTLGSCTYQKKLKRANRKIEKLTIKYPELLQTDTLHDTVTIVTPSIKYDTAFIDKPGDTTYITHEKLRIKYVRVGDTTFITGECEGDTIIQTVEIPFERIVIKKETLVDQVTRFVKSAVLWVFILLLLLWGIRLTWKLIKPF